MNNAGQVLLSVAAQSFDNWRALVVATTVPEPEPTGDFDEDGDVDAADDVLWRKTGIDGQQGYNAWRPNFGQPASGGTGEIEQSTPVPEPGSALALLWPAVFFLRRRLINSWSD